MRRLQRNRWSARSDKPGRAVLARGGDAVNAVRRSGTVPLGAIAGVAGTAAMTGIQLAIARARGTQPSDAPVKAARKIARGVAHRDVPKRRRPLVNNLVHWGYGALWGVAFAEAGRRVRARPLPQGLALGTLVWGASLAELPALSLAPAPWRQPPAELALDASYHLAYGVAVSEALALLRA